MIKRYRVLPYMSTQDDKGTWFYQGQEFEAEEESVDKDKAEEIPAESEKESD